MERKSIHIALVWATLLAAAACDGDRRVMLPDGGRDGGTDSGPDGGTDSGPDGGTDSGPDGGTDSGPGPDSGPAGMCGATIRRDDIPPLSAACLPRCSRTTLERLMMCAAWDMRCQIETLMMDTTPAIPWTINGMPAMQPLNCQTCFFFQQISCAHDVCPSETLAFLACNPMMDADMCNGELMMLDGCLTGTTSNQMAFLMCVQREARRCFATSSMFLPDFESHRLPPIPWSAIDFEGIEFVRQILGL
jgi:hypothetical protein